MGDELMPDTSDSNGRVGFRDIYRAVGESEQRIVARIDSAVTSLGGIATDHEARLRSIEAAVQAQGPIIIERERRLGAVEHKAETTETVVQNLLAREGGIFSTLGVGKTLIIIVMAVMGTAIALADFLSRVTVAGTS